MTTIGERLSKAWQALRGEKVAYNIVPAWANGTASYPAPTFVNNVNFGLRRNELIFTCVGITADSASTPTMRVRRKRTLEDLPEHPLRKLIAQPNPFMTEFDLHAATLMYLDLAGRAVWEKVRGKTNPLPVQLWPLRPDWLQPVPSQQTFISGYEYKPPFVTKGEPLEPNNVLEYKLYDPINMYGGLAPVAVAMRVGEVDNSQTDFIKLFFEHGGVPQGVLTTKLKLKDHEVDSLRARWREKYGGFENWVDPAILDNDATFQRSGLTMKEMGFGALDSRNEARICMVLRVPPIIVGATVGLDRSTFSNYGEARKSWWEDSLSPMYRRLADEANGSLVPEFGDDIECYWDFSNVPAYQEQRDALWKRATDALQSGGITVNDFRRLVGLPEDTVGGNVYLRSPQVVAVAWQSKPTQGEPEDEGNPDDEGTKIATLASGTSATKADGATAPDASQRAKDEARVNELVSEYMSGLRTRVGEIVGA